jgi:hypothetical protein
LSLFIEEESSMAADEDLWPEVFLAFLGAFESEDFGSLYSSWLCIILEVNLEAGGSMVGRLRLVVRSWKGV